MPPEPRDRASELLAQIEVGSDSTAELLSTVYAELRAIADNMMRGERDNHTLQPTALVHEAFVRLVQDEATLGNGRRRFLAIAARAMRNLLVDHARAHRTEKRGANWDRVTLDGLSVGDASEDIQILDLHAALEELQQLDERQARVVEMCFFAGMSGQEIADELGVHRNTVVSELRMARAWLRKALAQR